MADGIERDTLGLPRVDLGDRVRWETDRRGRLLIFDCSNNNRDEAYALFDAFQRTVLPEPPGTVRVLMDFENAAHETELTRRWKEASLDHNRQITKAAMVGVTGGMKIVLAAYRFYARMKGMEIETKTAFFEDETAARAWLEVE